MAENGRQTGQTLRTALSGWLSGRIRIDPSLAPGLEEQFLTETMAARVRATRSATSMTIGLDCLVIPVAWISLPDAHAVVIFAWIFLAIPLCVLRHSLLHAELSMRAHEAVILGGNLGLGLCFSLLVLSTHAEVAPMYLGGMMVIALFGGVGQGLRFQAACWLHLGVFLEFVASVFAAPSIAPVTASALSMLIQPLLGASLLGNWRIETETRRSYAMAALERRARLALARDNAVLDELANVDALTSLANRRTYDRWLAETWEQALRDGSSIGLVMLDVDHFKKYNDFLGHAAGDACLRATALCLREQSRGATDQVARFGGEEFAVLLPGLALEASGEVAERLRAAIAALDMPHPDSALGRVTVSCGVASVRVLPGTSPAILFSAADAALYAAKADGRNCVRLADMSRGASPAPPCEARPGQPSAR